MLLEILQNMYMLLKLIMAFSQFKIWYGTFRVLLQGYTKEFKHVKLFYMTFI